jgi:hypothetical protein
MRRELIAADDRAASTEHEQIVGSVLPDAPGVPRAYVPCPICRSPIELRSYGGELLRRVTCPDCETVLER